MNPNEARALAIARSRRMKSEDKKCLAYRGPYPGKWGELGATPRTGAKWTPLELVRLNEQVEAMVAEKVVMDLRALAVIAWMLGRTSEGVYNKMIDRDAHKAGRRRNILPCFKHFSLEI